MVEKALRKAKVLTLRRGMLTGRLLNPKYDLGEEALPSFELQQVLQLSTNTLFVLANLELNSSYKLMV